MTTGAWNTNEGDPRGVVVSNNDGTWTNFTECVGEKGLTIKSSSGKDYRLISMTRYEAAQKANDTNDSFFDISEKTFPPSLSKYKDTSQYDVLRRFSVPLKMTSCMFLPRRVFALCSPRVQRIASAMFDLPQPLGPMIAVTPSLNSMVTLSAKDLNPYISSLFKYILVPPIVFFII